MIHGVFWIYTFTFATSWCALVSGCVIWFKYKKAILKYFLQILGALFLILSSFMVNHYFLISGIDFSSGILAILSPGIGYFGTILSFRALPLFAHAISGNESGFLFRILHRIGGLSIAVFGILQLSGIAAPLWMIQMILFSSMFYSTFHLVSRRKIWGIHQFSKTIGIGGVISLIFLPFVIADMVLGDLVFLPFNLSLTLFLLAMSFYSLYLLFTILNLPAYEENGCIADYFISSFSLTNREVEIVSALIQGLSNKEIGESLFISPKTVENHLSSIYRKTSVTGRMQLVNLIKRNRSS